MDILERLNSTAANHQLAGTKDIYDDNSGQYQNIINSEFVNVNIRKNDTTARTFADAVALVGLRSKGLVCTFLAVQQDGTSKWESWQFKGSDTTDTVWKNQSNWMRFGAEILHIKGDALDKVMSQSAVTAYLNAIDTNAVNLDTKINQVNTTLTESINTLSDEVAAFSGETDERLTELEGWREDIDTEVISDNPEYIRVIVDSEGHLLWGIREDGSIEWQKGIPTPVQEEFLALEDRMFTALNDLETSLTQSLNDLETSMTEAFDDIQDNHLNQIEALRNVIRGKVSIIGDSIATFNQDGYKTEGYAMFYPNEELGVTDVNDTYWMQAINATSGASLEVNASYSGSGAVKTFPDESNAVGFYSRTFMLGSPDTIIVALGTNDSSRAVPVGDTYKFDTEQSELDENIFKDAYIKGIRSLQQNYPGKSIVALIYSMGDAYSNAIKVICARYGVTVVDFGRFAEGMGHPDKEWMGKIADKLLKAYLNPQNQIDSLSAVTNKLIDNPEYLQATLDSEDRILEAIKEDGTKYFPNKIQQGEVVRELVDNPEYLKAILDSDEHLLFGIKEDGSIEWQKGIPTPIQNKFDEFEADANEKLEEIYNDHLAQIEVLRNVIRGKVSIIGDGASTFDLEGYNIPGYSMYYPNESLGIVDVNDTYWMQAINATSGASLEVNASYSGSGAVKTFPGNTTAVGFYPRVSMLGNPDTIIVALGSNDSSRAVPVGTDFKFDAEMDELDENIFCEAYLKGMRALQMAYPGKNIVALILSMNKAYSDAIKTICARLGVAVIFIGGYSDGIANPNMEWMSRIADKLLNAYINPQVQLSSLSDASNIIIENPEYLQATLDADGRILEAIKEDGTKYFPNRIEQGEVVRELVDNPEYLKAIIDADGHLLWGIKEDGSVDWQKGVPAPVQEAINRNNVEIYLNEKTGALTVYSDSLNSAFQEGSIDRTTGKISLKFDFRDN